MQQRAPTPAASLDYFPTPPWATRALGRFIIDQGEPLPALSCWEPACGELHMARPLTEFFAAVRPTDVMRYHADHGICDFLLNGRTWSPLDWVITNPPFKLAQAFIDTAMAKARRGVAMLVRSAFTEGAERHHSLFNVTPPTFELQFAERVVMLKGRLIQANAPDPFNLDADGKPTKASSATSYCWLIWMRDQSTGHWIADTRKRWVPPLRMQLERPGDYPEYPEQWARVRAAQAGCEALALAELPY